MKRPKTMVSFENTGVRLVQLPQLYGGKNGVTSIHQGKPQPTQCCCYHRVICVAHPSSPQLSSPLYWLSHPAQTTSGLWKTRRWSRRATKASRKKKWKKGYKERWKPNGTEKTVLQRRCGGEAMASVIPWSAYLCAHAKVFFKTSQVFGNINFICIKYIYRIAD